MQCYWTKVNLDSERFVSHQNRKVEVKQKHMHEKPTWNLMLDNWNESLSSRYCKSSTNMVEIVSSSQKPIKAT